MHISKQRTPFSGPGTQIQTPPAERSLLVGLGMPLGNAIQEMLSLVHYKTFLRWVREEKAGLTGAKKPSCKPGRPPIPQNVEEIILRMAKETGWGYHRRAV